MYGTILIGTSAHYCVILDITYNQFDCKNANGNGSTKGTYGDTTLPPGPSFDVFCELHTEWRSCAIVGMFVGTLILVYSIGNIYFRYSGNDDGYVDLDSDESNGRLLCSLGFVAIVSIVMITTVFSVLIDSQANTIGYDASNGLKPAAVANIVVLGLGVAAPVLGILVGVVLIPILRCTEDFRDSLRY